MHADLALRSHLDGKRFQAGLVTIGEREVAAALRKLDCERATDAARRSRDSGRAANRRHEISRQVRTGNNNLHFFRLEQNRPPVPVLTWITWARPSIGSHQ